ncbi:MAG: hypothetical protein PHQ19_09250 [Candidatus Krumholzibacteria bacterium]|nr:hypothetical protein [Candidatus Krumholzibacteria bacterium]
MRTTGRRRGHLVLIAVLTAAAWTAPVRSQEGPPPENDATANSLRPGAWAIQFLVEGGSTNIFGVTDLSVKRHLTKRSAVRIGVRVDVNFEDSNSEFDLVFLEAEDEWSEEETKLDSDNLTVLFEALYLGYLRHEGRLSIFAGAGPVTGYLSSSSDRVRTIRYADGSSLVETFTDSDSGWTAGGLGLIGAEYFITKSFSIHTEYRVSLLYQRRTGEESAYREDGGAWDRRYDTAIRTWELDAGIVFVGLNGYF